ncbi:MAG: dTDP-4-dehydrorhamnose reductase [Chloroflexi bacterium]|nr:dTDP-4-dehydrorhamnose reductase [Chloroflexota bacterium]
MRILITGHKGQLGRALFDAMDHHTLTGCDLPESDITDRAAIGETIVDFAPDVVIHAAAWTDVDGCARDPDRAYVANAIGTQNVALACAACDAAMVYVSTNEVFDGRATVPYLEWDDPCPINPYGRSKAAGEWCVRHLLRRFYIARTAWLYAGGGRNFPHRIVQLADERGQLRVVQDEVGNPTYAPDLAQAIAALVQTEAYGVYHLVNSGHCSRFEFAQAILHITGRDHIPIEPIHQSDFQRASTPPAFAPLANTAAAAHGVHLRPWDEALREFLATVD